MMRAIVAATLPLVASPAAWAQGVEFRALEQLPAVGGSLLAVLVMIVGVAWLLRRSPLGALSRGHGPLRVVATLPLGPKERLVLVEAGESRILLGVAPAGIVALQGPAELPARPAAAPMLRPSATAAAPAADVRTLLQERR